MCSLIRHLKRKTNKPLLPRVKTSSVWSRTPGTKQKKMKKENMIVVATLPAVQRDLLIARCVRRIEDTPESLQTLEVRWSDMIVEFATDSAITEASVAVDQTISISIFSTRMEVLLDCGAKTDGATEWVLKFSALISTYGLADEVRRLLCDKIASLNGKTGETIGVMKIKRRSVNSGHAKIRLVPEEDSMQVVCRHTTAQGLKSVWKSVLWRLKPQHGAQGNTEEWQRLIELCERQEWGNPAQSGLNCYIYQNGVDMQTNCADGELPNVYFNPKGGGNSCRWSGLQQLLNGRKFKIIRYSGKLYLKF